MQNQNRTLIMLVIDPNPILYFWPNQARNRNAVIETKSKPKVNGKYERISNSENISQNQNYAVCLKFMVFWQKRGNPLKSMLCQKPNPEFGWNWVWSTRKLVPFGQNPNKQMTICCSNSIKLNNCTPWTDVTLLFVNFINNDWEDVIFAQFLQVFVPDSWPPPTVLLSLKLVTEWRCRKANIMNYFSISPSFSHHIKNFLRFPWIAGAEFSSPTLHLKESSRRRRCQHS